MGQLYGRSTAATTVGVRSGTPDPLAGLERADAALDLVALMAKTRSTVNIRGVVEIVKGVADLAL